MANSDPMQGFAPDDGITAREPPAPRRSSSDITAVPPAESKDGDRTDWSGGAFAEVPAFPTWALIWFLAGGASFAFLAGPQWPMTVIGVSLFWIFAVVFAHDFFRPVRYSLGETGLATSRPKRFVPYDEIVDVEAGVPDSKGLFPLHIMTTKGFVTIPKRLTCPSRDVLALLRQRARGDVPSAEVPAFFETFLRQQRLLYPPEQIHIFRGFKRPLRPSAFRPYIKAILALGLPVPLWIVLANAFPKHEAFFVASIVGTLATVIAILCSLGGFSRNFGIKNPDEAILILTPAGLALNQGHLRGELRWSEIKKISHVSQNSFQLTSSGRHGLQLVVAGAVIAIGDIYNWPIDAIHNLIRAYSGR